MNRLEKITFRIWDKPSQIICCTKGIFVFVKDGEQEIMQQKIIEFFK